MSSLKYTFDVSACPEVMFFLIPEAYRLCLRSAKIGIVKVCPFTGSYFEVFAQEWSFVAKIHNTPFQKHTFGESTCKFSKQNDPNVRNSKTKLCDLFFENFWSVSFWSVKFTCARKFSHTYKASLV